MLSGDSTWQEKLKAAEQDVELVVDVAENLFAKCVLGCGEGVVLGEKEVVVMLRCFRNVVPLLKLQKAVLEDTRSELTAARLRCKALEQQSLAASYFCNKQALHSEQAHLSRRTREINTDTTFMILNKKSVGLLPLPARPCTAPTRALPITPHDAPLPVARKELKRPSPSPSPSTHIKNESKVDLRPLTPTPAARISSWDKKLLATLQAVKHTLSQLLFANMVQGTCSSLVVLPADWRCQHASFEDVGLQGIARRIESFQQEGRQPALRYTMMDCEEGVLRAAHGKGVAVRASSQSGASLPVSALLDTFTKEDSSEARAPCFFLTLNEVAPFIEFHVHDLVLVPARYRLWTSHPMHNGYLLRNWCLLGGLHDSKWEVLRRHTNDTSLKGADRTAEWCIERCPDWTLPYFNKFRIVLTGPNCLGTYELQLSSADFYGRYLHVVDAQSAAFPAPPRPTFCDIPSVRHALAVQRVSLKGNLQPRQQATGRRWGALPEMPLIPKPNPKKGKKGK